MGPMTIVARAWLGLLAFLLVCFAAENGGAATLFSPDTRWHTLATPHFRVNYPDGLEDVARRAAVFAEEAHARLVPWMKTIPAQPTELTLLDHEDEVNGFAFPYPNNQIFVYVTSPSQDFHDFGRYESWLKTVITHEYTHVLHFETVGGLVAAIDKVFGRVFFPNLIPGQPFFLIEGLAVTGETAFTQGGRGHSSSYEMVLRAGALDGKLLTLDQVGGYHSMTWPGGAGVYIYGTHFYKFLTARYGPESGRRVAEIYGAEPWFGIDAAFHKAIGRDLYQVWEEFIRHLERRYQVQAAQIRQNPLTPYRPITSGGRYHRHPAFLPDGRLIYAEATGHGWGQVKVLEPAPAGSGSAGDLPRFDPARATALFAKGPLGSMSMTSDGRWIFFGAGHQRDRYHFHDELYRYDTRDRACVRLTTDQRASDPAVSPDGTQVMAVLNHQGRNDLAVFDPGGTLLRRLTRSGDGTRIGGLKWSPDGRWVAASVWHDGWRDLYLVDPASGEMTPLWRDAASDFNPAWTRDGKWLLFSSDRTGVFNLHAVRMADRQVFQVTNVLTGAFEPAPSPDGRILAFTVYTSDGYEIATMPFRPDEWRPAVEGVYEASDGDGRFEKVEVAFAKEPWPEGPDARLALEATPEPRMAGNPREESSVPAGNPRPAAATDSLRIVSAEMVPAPATGLFKSEPYDPWTSLRPKAWLPNFYMPDEDGAGLGISLLGYDTLLQHQFAGTVGLGLGTRRPQYALSYTTDVLEPTLSVSLSDTPGAYPVLEKKDSGKILQTWRREIQAGAAATFPGVPSALLGQLHVTGDFFTLSFNRTQSIDLGSEVPSGCGDVPRLTNSRLAPTADVESRCLSEPGAIRDAKAVPLEGVTSVVGLRFRHADHYKFGYSISPEGGSMVSLSYDKASPLWGSQASFDRLSLDYRTHVAGFWPHHVWAFRLTAGFNYGGRGGGFRLGGNSPTMLYDIIDARSLGPFQEVPLRGHPPRNGDRVAALNVEYRFPLGEIQRGFGSLPLYFDRWYGAWLYDVGNVWTERYDPNGLRQSVGLQARAKLHVMNVPIEVGVGVAQGTSPLGLAKDIAPKDRRQGSWEFGESLLPPPEILAQIGTTF